MKRSSVLPFALLLVAGVFLLSCQKDEAVKSDELSLKVGVENVGDINVSYPSKVYTEIGNEYFITFSSDCGDVNLYEAPPGDDCDDFPDDWGDPIVEYDCGSTAASWELNFEDDEVGMHYYMAELVGEPCNTCTPTTTTECIEIEVCREETAFAGNGDPIYNGGWFYLFETEGVTTTATIWADAGVDEVPEAIGEVEFNVINNELIITLDACWHLWAKEEDDDNEPVKIMYYADGDAPSKRPKGNKYDIKLPWQDGNVITVNVSGRGSMDNFVVHLEVESCELCGQD